MLRFDAPRPARFCDGFTRRAFLHAGALVPLGLTLPGLLRAEQQKPKRGDGDVNCIMLFLVGGPSQIDTFDPKPKAPDEVRGPFKPIPTKAPGIQITEIFPKVAGHTDKFSIIRSVYHTPTRVHHTAHQMRQTPPPFPPPTQSPHPRPIFASP